MDEDTMEKPIEEEKDHEEMKMGELQQAIKSINRNLESQ